MSVEAFEISPGIGIGDGAPLLLIAGPCVIESREQALEVAERAAAAAAGVGLPYVFKSSFDKANRTAISSFRGPGMQEGLEILGEVGERVGVPVLTDVHLPDQVEAAAAVADVIQVPAFLCRQTDLLVAAARSGRVVNVKKGQFLSPWEVPNIVGKVRSAGGSRLMITERGSSFGYSNLVVDMKSIPLIREAGVPAVFDATHSVQLPGGEGNRTGGLRQFVPTLARAAVAAGADALFLEVHADPDSAPCDGPNMWPLDRLEELLRDVAALAEVARAWRT